MASNDWQDNFRRRCDFVGWTTELSKGSNHYKVYDATGKYLFTYAKTSGDRRSMLNTVTEAKRHGIETLETQEKLRQERERLVRIEKDRETNGHVVADVSSINRGSSEGERRMTEAKIENHYAESRDAVLGVSVLIREKASLTSHNIQTKVTETHVYPDIDALQLENDTVVYQCASRRDTTCLFTAASPQSVRAHLRAHSPRADAAKLAAELAEAEQRAAEAQAELDARIKRKSDGSKQAVETRRKRAEAAANGHAPVTAVSTGAVATDADRAAIERIRKTADALGRELDELGRGLQHVAKSMAQLSNDVDRIPSVDPTISAKAKAFDELQALLSRPTT